MLFISVKDSVQFSSVAQSCPTFATLSTAVCAEYLIEVSHEIPVKNVSIEIVQWVHS